MKSKLLLPLTGLLIMLSLISAFCTSEAAPAASITPTTASSHWWDDMGEPKYGGELVSRVTSWEFQVDPTTGAMGIAITVWLESLFAEDWTVSPDVYGFLLQWCPEEYMAGILAESWEYKDPQTVIVKIRKGVHWQDKSPVNGRELTAKDVQYSYDFILGTGSGFTEPHKFWTRAISSIERVVAVDKYTVEFKLKKQSAMAIYDVVAGNLYRTVPIIAREWYEQGNTGDWKNAVGTGPWMLTDVVENVSYTYSRNPNYWGFDERHPENQLPYADTYKTIVIADQSTALAAMRSAQIDWMTANRAGALTLQQAKSLTKTKPEIVQSTYPGSGASLELRCDIDPFTDIRVRKALNLAIDRELIAKAYYQGTVDGKPSGIVNPSFTGYAYTYDEWTQSLKDEYSYNPDKAKELLAEAGFPNGFKTNIVTDAADANIELLEIIKAEFMDIGVDMEIRTMDLAQFRFWVSAGKHDAMAFSSRQAAPFGPVDGLSLRTYKHPMDYTHNNDDRFVGLVAEIQKATTMDEARTLIKEADKYSLEQHWAAYVCPTVIPIVWQPYLKGYNGESTQNDWWGFIPARVWLDK